ncbi:hypothetical protein NIES2104_41170 [Leptolyngbya sp. NIES-2104]|nr:hypothetical protein NIES2104_41170 [Leptolyngbya sp. NIES-2104]
MKPETVLTSKEISCSKSLTRGGFRELRRSVAPKDQFGITWVSIVDLKSAIDFRVKV